MAQGAWAQPDLAFVSVVEGARRRLVRFVVEGLRPVVVA